MATRSAKTNQLYETFKTKATVIKLKGADGSIKEAVRYDGKLYTTGSLIQVFDIVKNKMN